MIGATARAYGRVAWCYDALARAYSLGRIPAAKQAQLRHLRPGDRVLYVGVGRGRDLQAAVARGALCTALDTTPEMLRRLRGELDRSGRDASLVRGDLFAFEPSAPFDAVVANFVLNVFGPRRMPQALTRLARWVRPGGLLMIADFAPARGSAWQRACVRAYYAPVAAAGWALGMADWHGLYDYARHLEELGLETIECRAHSLVARGPAVFETLIARRAGDGVPTEPARVDGPALQRHPCASKSRREPSRRGGES